MPVYPLCCRLRMGTGISAATFITTIVCICRRSCRRRRRTTATACHCRIVVLATVLLRPASIINKTYRIVTRLQWLLTNGRRQRITVNGLMMMMMINTATAVVRLHRNITAVAAADAR